MVKNFISAAEARQLTVTSDKLLNQVFKFIREASAYGHCVVNFDIYEAADTVVLKIITALTDAGYSVVTETDDDNKPRMLVITW